jgi:hypothetical protein
VYILKNSLPSPTTLGGGISADAIWGKKYEKEEEKKRNMWRNMEKRQKITGKSKLKGKIKKAKGAKIKPKRVREV